MVHTHTNKQYTQALETCWIIVVTRSPNNMSRGSYNKVIILSHILYFEHDINLLQTNKVYYFLEPSR
jgi:hypothetical protein